MTLRLSVNVTSTGVTVRASRAGLVSTCSFDRVRISGVDLMYLCARAVVEVMGQDTVKTTLHVCRVGEVYALLEPSESIYYAVEVNP